MPETIPPRPLSHIRVLDLTNVLSGPFCCHQLAHLGAEVIKVEVPGHGDLARQLGADPDLNQKHMGISFLAQNPGKKSITINLKSQGGKTVFRKLVKTADVLVENFRPGVMTRLGVGYETLSQDHSKLVYCAISGFGQDGPLKGLPAYDQIIQGMSGLMSITGAPGTAPYRVGYPMADTIGGMTAAFAISSALANRESRKGCFIDVSMLEAVMATMGWVVSNYLVAGKEPAPLGNENFTASPSGTFATGGGMLNIAANKQEQFEALARVIDREDLITDPRFAQRQDRLDRRFELKGIIEDIFQQKSAIEWEKLLSKAGVPVGRVLSVPEALAHPQLADRGMIGSFEDVPGIGRDINLLRTGFKINGAAPEVASPPPELGADTGAVLTELGYSPEEIEILHAEGAI